MSKTICKHCGLERRIPAHDCVKELRALVERLRQRLHDQTMATQEAAEYYHNAVLARLTGRVPEGINPQAHPIDEIVACVIYRLESEIRRLRQ